MLSFLPRVDFSAQCESYFEGNGNFTNRWSSLLSLNGNCVVFMKVMTFSVCRCFKSPLGILIEKVRMVYLVAFELELNVVFWKTFYCAGCDRLPCSGDRSIEDFCRWFRVGRPGIIFAQLVCCWRPHWAGHCTLWWDFYVAPTTKTRMDKMRSRCFRRVGRLRCRNRTDLWTGYDPVVHFRRTVFLFRRNLASRKGTVLYSFESGWRCRSWQGHHSGELRSTPIGNCLVEVELCWLSCWLLLYSSIRCYQIKLSTYYSHLVSRALFVTALLLV